MTEVINDKLEVIMERLIEQYNKNCSLTSKVANILWKIGQIIIILMSFYISIPLKKAIIGIIILMFGIIILYFICTYIEIISICKKLQLNIENKKIIKLSYRKEIYEKINMFQKKWIVEYCKKNRIDKIEKIKILREELERKEENNSIKYINLIIIGTLLLNVWAVLVQEMFVKFGGMKTISISILFSIILSIIIGWINKELKEQIEFWKYFNSFSGYKRLSELLLYRILKLNK